MAFGCPSDSSTWSALLKSIVGGTVPSAAGIPNPNFCAQMAEWQAARKAGSEDPYDWAAFRTHLVSVYAPDPGPTAPPEFKSAGGGLFDIDWKWLLLGLAVVIVIGQMRKGGVQYGAPSQESVWEERPSKR
jgi:hypothetical protein